jgi:hypothetical protein
MAYVVAIPSYNRPNEVVNKTLKTLKAGGINKNSIYIFVANAIEHKKYEEIVPKDLYGKLVVGKLGIANQRIFIKHYFKENQHVVSIDDDVEALFKLTAGTPRQPRSKTGTARSKTGTPRSKTGTPRSKTGTARSSAEIQRSAAKLVKITNVDKFFKEAFARLKREKLFIWGIYPVRNPFFMQNTVTTGLKFIIGALYGFIVRKTPQLEPSVNAEGKEDYEQSILYFKKDGGVLRYNNVTIKTKFLAKGGLGADRFAMNKKAAEYLKKTYPDLVTIFNRKNGMTEVKLANIKQGENKDTRKNVTNSTGTGKGTGKGTRKGTRKVKH